eukprot:gene24239-198_t
MWNDGTALNNSPKDYIFGCLLFVLVVFCLCRSCGKKGTVTSIHYHQRLSPADITSIQAQSLTGDATRPMLHYQEREPPQPPQGHQGHRPPPQSAARPRTMMHGDATVSMDHGDAPRSRPALQSPKPLQSKPSKPSSKSRTLDEAPRVNEEN